MATNSGQEILEASLDRETILDQSELVSAAEVALGEEQEEEEGEGVWLPQQGHTSSLSQSTAEQERQSKLFKRRADGCSSYS